MLFVLQGGEKSNNKKTRLSEMQERVARGASAALWSFGVTFYY